MISYVLRKYINLSLQFAMFFIEEKTEAIL